MNSRTRIKATADRVQDLSETDHAVPALIELVGRRVREARKSQQLSRRVLSERSGVSPRYLAKLEAGDGNISIGLLKRVAVALSVPLDALLVEEGPLAEEVRQMAELYRRADAATRTQVMQVLDPDRMRARKAERLCLVGLRGAGKSTLGVRVSAALGVPFVELNKRIEEDAGMPIGEIIALYGQEGYRQLEADTLSAIVDDCPRAIVAVAGGIVSEPDTFHTVMSRFHTVWVKAAAGEHMDRVRAQGDIRPMAGNPQAMIQLRQILKAREALYAQADHQLDTSGKSVDDSEAELLALIRDAQIVSL